MLCQPVFVTEIKEEKKRVVCIELQCSHNPKIILLTLLFFSSSNTGFLGRGEGDGINVASRGISGSTETIPKIKMTTDSYSTLEMTVSGHQGDKITLKKHNAVITDCSVNYFWMSL